MTNFNLAAGGRPFDQLARTFRSVFNDDHFERRRCLSVDTLKRTLKEAQAAPHGPDNETDLGGGRTDGHLFFSFRLRSPAAGAFWVSQSPSFCKFSDLVTQVTDFKGTPVLFWSP